MKKGYVVYAAIVAILLAVGAALHNRQELVATDANGADYLEWCDSIYHQNVGCPQHGKVVVPASVLARQEAEHLAWCDSIYHQNVGCPQHGKVTIPREVLAKQEAHRLEWCDSINHQNVSCPKYGR